MFSPKISNIEIYEEKLNIDILNHTRREILTDMPLLSSPLNVLKPSFKEGCHTFSTEGIHLFYEGDMIRRLFRDNPLFLRRLMLHQMLHCLYLHLWKRDGMIREIWDIACDIAVERAIDNLGLRALKRPLTLLRKTVYDHINDRGRNVVISPGFIYNEIITGIPGVEPLSLASEFYTDDHSLWPVEEERDKDKEAYMDPPKSAAQKNWEKQGRKTSLENVMGDSSSENGSQNAGDTLISGIIKDSGAKSYRYFLHHFMSVNEKQGVSSDDFDLSFYSYGLQIYDNIPLIEDLEAYEDSSLKQMIVVIDTSYSTQGETVRSFLQETADLLKEEGLWARGGSIRILQCDDDIRSDMVISTYDDMDRIFEDFHLTGGGNTDFRPPFAYINSLIEKGEADKSTGVLYFTDGLGIYPKKDPGYKTAFLFTGEYDRSKIPPWAIHRKVSSNEYKTGKAGNNKHI